MKNLLIAASAFLLILLVAVTLPAASEVTSLQAKDSGREIQVKVGALIELSLPEQAGTGYQWEFDRLDQQHFELLKTATRSLAEKHLVGGPVLKTWRLKAKTAGDSQLTLDYFRSWEGRGQAVKHFQVKVRIR
ncbi:MAG: protease inhibitor I42 family protein [Syntrophobacterales bacterium]|jgi:inhibitor of cysteine peptidase|nr:protease inhibitor I42 family protein [Syntrophobacterales bacterium]